MSVLLEFEKPIRELEKKLEALRTEAERGEESSALEVKRVEKELKSLKINVYENLTPWQRVQLARHPLRPLPPDFISWIFEDFMEFHGDRMFAEDCALQVGFARLGSLSVCVVCHHKGLDTREKIKRHFGMAHPEGYRKAMRLFRLAEKMGIPVISFIDTPGAYPGLGAEERGQGEAIASSLKLLSSLKVPLISLITGEGGSGGALAICSGDCVLMLENAVFSVISPEGCAAILFKDAKKAETAAAAMKMTSKELLANAVVDEVIPEPLGGAHLNRTVCYQKVREVLEQRLSSLLSIPLEKLLENRYLRYRNFF